MYENVRGRVRALRLGLNGRLGAGTSDGLGACLDMLRLCHRSSLVSAGSNCAGAGGTGEVAMNEDDPLGPSKGISLGLGLALAFWAVVIVLAWWAL